MQILVESLWFIGERQEARGERLEVKKIGDTIDCVPCLYLFKDICWFISQQHLARYTQLHSKEYGDNRSRWF